MHFMVFYTNTPYFGLSNMILEGESFDLSLDLPLHEDWSMQIIKKSVKIVLVRGQGGTHTAFAQECHPLGLYIYICFNIQLYALKLDLGPYLINISFSSIALHYPHYFPYKLLINQT